MALPEAIEYQEAVQIPSSFRDPELREAVLGTDTLGLPRVCSGNFASVYQFRGRSGKAWAVKCFTHEAPNLQDRYQILSDALARRKLPVMVPFEYQAEGIRVQGRWYPILKMRWVEGLTLNEFVRQNANRAGVLRTMVQLWVRMAELLDREQVVHGDLQHGNVLLVRKAAGNTLAVKLIDYDGMQAPGLEWLPSGEVGHQHFQHPKRASDGYLGEEVDWFSHLAICTALIAVAWKGEEFWARFDMGDNLLFTREDYEHPGRSAILKELWRQEDPLLRTLAGRLVLASKGEWRDVPPLNWILDERGEARQVLLAAEERAIERVFGEGKTRIWTVQTNR